MSGAIEVWAVIPVEARPTWFLLWFSHRRFSDGRGQVWKDWVVFWPWCQFAVGGTCIPDIVAGGAVSAAGS